MPSTPTPSTPTTVTTATATPPIPGTPTATSSTTASDTNSNLATITTVAATTSTATATATTTTTTVAIPKTQQVKPTTSGGSQSGYRILIAEDNKINKVILCRVLSSLQYSDVETVENGQEVLNNLKSGKRYDIILMDLHMPIMDGLVTTKTIREMLPPEECPLVIAVTADVMQGIQTRCRDAGMAGYISKPLVKAKVADVLLRVTSIPHGEVAWVC
eukprot:TRINITY_DN868_c1_g1_i1.p1 TRINITY_DN868_c1_g1~~TRINITY_DN868_c1_g1_i1.p1  ORF type:complete len:217 (-),score=69.29 TRINITY_DN868_c1_g1_i1:3-653(-)